MYTAFITFHCCHYFKSHVDVPVHVRKLPFCTMCILVNLKLL